MKEIIFNRRSIRKYDETKKIDRKTFEEFLEAVKWAPSSQNLQPWRLIVIETSEAKERIKPFFSGNFNQLNTSSAMVLFLIDLDKEKESFNSYDDLVEKGTMSKETRDFQVARILKSKSQRTKTELLEIGILDIGLIAMNFMLLAKKYGLDTCAIGGFNKSPELVEILGFDSKRYVPSLFISIGYALDKGHVSSRLPNNKIITYL